MTTQFSLFPTLKPSIPTFLVISFSSNLHAVKHLALKAWTEFGATRHAWRLSPHQVPSYLYPAQKQLHNVLNIQVS